MHKKGLTLLEILVSTLILALVMTGLANIFVAGKRHLLHSRSRMTGGELGRYFLDDFQMQVRQDTWNDPGNWLGAASRPEQQIGKQQGLDRDYKGQYVITPNSPINNLNKVKVTIIWDEPPP